MSYGVVIIDSPPPLLSIISYSSGTSLIWLDDVECDSDDLFLFTCSHSGIGRHDCTNFQNVAIECSGVIPNSRFSYNGLHSYWFSECNIFTALK